MNNRIQRIALGASLLVLPLLAMAQTTLQSLRAEIDACPEKAGGIYYAYPTPSGKQTPAPKGYEPVYVSHYGRHGSRWLTSDARYEYIIHTIDTCAAHSGLTPLGQDLRQRLSWVWDDVKGRGGQLSALGERQHKEIAGRLYQRYPSVFSDSARMDVSSSTVMRCVISMVAFTERLKELNPALRIDRAVSQRTMEYIAHDTDELRQWYTDTLGWHVGYHAFEQELLQPERFLKALFVNPAEVADGRDFMKRLFQVAVDMQDVDVPTPDGRRLSFFDLYTKDEIFALWQVINYSTYICNSDATLNGGVSAESARNLLNHIIAEADKALAGGPYKATLRFGHDTYLMRLLSLMQLDGCAPHEADPARYAVAWQDFHVSPMGANVQLIFFRNRKCDVLVKVLHNEEEVGLPIPSETAPYYKWDDVKAFWTK
jgi:hypothetical protein